MRRSDYDYLRSIGMQGAASDMLNQFLTLRLSKTGATSDLLMEWLEEKGYVDGALADREQGYLTATYGKDQSGLDSDQSKYEDEEESVLTTQELKDLYSDAEIAAFEASETVADIQDVITNANNALVDSVLEADVNELKGDVDALVTAVDTAGTTLDSAISEAQILPDNTINGVIDTIATGIDDAFDAVDAAKVTVDAQVIVVNAAIDSLEAQAVVSMDSAAQAVATTSRGLMLGVAASIVTVGVALDTVTPTLAAFVVALASPVRAVGRVLAALFGKR